ncbi:unnamed protein product [Linum trigynum]|uniref:Uncharacterized protein n=1 Tax=Linum trigynum TaxID=586398 RepID=A0AAV2EMM8_9ROSI
MNSAQEGFHFPVASRWQLERQPTTIPYPAARAKREENFCYNLTEVGAVVAYFGSGSSTSAQRYICVLFNSAGGFLIFQFGFKEINPALRNLSYDIADLYNFIDGLADLSALVYFLLLLSPFLFPH